MPFGGESLTPDPMYEEEFVFIASLLLIVILNSVFDKLIFVEVNLDQANEKASSSGLTQP